MKNEKKHMQKLCRLCTKKDGEKNLTTCSIWSFDSYDKYDSLFSSKTKSFVNSQHPPSQSSRLTFFQKIM